jgi:hypothetical protein
LWGLTGHRFDTTTVDGPSKGGSIGGGEQEESGIAAGEWKDISEDIAKEMSKVG